MTANCTAIRPLLRRLGGALAVVAALSCLPGGPVTSEVRAQPLPRLVADVQAGRATPEEALLLAKIWIERKRHARALALLDPLPAATPAFEAARQVLRGLCYEGLQDAGRAADAYVQALVAVPDDSAALLRLGALHYARGDQARARALLVQSVAAGPANPEAWYYLYVLALLPDEAADALRQLLVADGPAGPWAQRALARRNSP